MALAAPTEKDGFFYAGDVLYCETSNLNRHRRATLSELKAHFNGKGTDNNHPAHWYEAQLIHYGLPPSKVKGTAHKRLFDAVMKGGLTVPSNIQKIEADLKKEWTKREREAKKMVKESRPEAKKSAKRKADQVSASSNVSVNVSVQISSSGQVTMQAAPSSASAKKAKTVPTTKTAAPTKSLKKPASKPSEAAPKSANAKATKAASKATSPVRPAPPTFKGKGTTMPTQTARQFKPRGPVPATGFAMEAMGGPGLDEAPPPYSEFNPHHGSSSKASQESSPHRAKLGLLNGRYTVRSSDLDDQFGHKAQPDFGLIATLDGSRLWLQFDFGAVVGIMQLGRPYSVSDGRLDTIWHGHVPDGYGGSAFVNQGVDNWNWVEFRGDGYLEGSISWLGSSAYRFEAERLPGQPPRSEISPSEMRTKYENYEQYERY